MTIHREVVEEEDNKDQTEKETEEEEEQPLVLRTSKVVEYLEPFMSLELLYKFPDNSAYDFDYSQSTIWSPLVPRAAYNPMDFDLITPSKRKLSYDKGLEFGLGARRTRRNSENKVGPKLEKNLSFCKKQKKNKKKKMMGSESHLSPRSSRIKNACNPAIMKGWDKLLKVASKQFKRWKPKRDPIAHVMLTKSYRDGDF